MKKYLLFLLILLSSAKGYAQCNIEFVADTNPISDPFNVVDVGTNSTPTFTDIDNDGDLDAFIGEYYGHIYYYQNTGSLSSPVFILQTGSTDPFNGIQVASMSTPSFADIDNDGDMDAFIGEEFGDIHYYQNTGSSSSPVFALQTGATDPFNGVDVGYNATPSFADIDNDGDMDPFIGESNGNINYYQNTGSSSSPVFALQTGSADPFNGVNALSYSALSFVDIDNDGDMDAFIGEAYGNIYYYQNTGSSSNPVFALQTGTANPFNGVDVGFYSAPSFADIDNDGDMDAFIGESNGNINYYYNSSSNGLGLVANIVDEVGINDGAVDVTTNGGLAPYLYDWDNDGTGDYDDNEDISGLAAATYTLVVIDANACSDTITVVINKTSTEEIIMPDNGGLYGGSSADLTFSQTGNRLFSGIETPASLFISDDNATTWYQAFDNDSLEDASESRGWSGKATRIVGNQKGWVAVQTNHPKLKYSSAVISYSNGDTNTWQTVVDPARLTEWGFASHHVSAIALSDYYLMAALGPFIVKKDSGKINPLTDVISILTTIFNFPLTSTINSIALSNNTNAYPYYIAVDESGDENGYNRRLLKYDGTNFTELTLPSTLNGIRAVFTHPAQTTADTLFITGMDVNTNAYKIYKSFDAGNNWTDISYSSATDFLSDIDYSTNWNLSASNNSILIIPGNAISKDMGSTWETLGTDHTANAIDPTNVNTIVGSGKSIEISTTGTTGSFTKTTSYGLAALEVNKIARTENKSIFYIATKTGLGYTTAYLDTTISAGQKWETPYGQFPLISDTINFGAVAIDPADSLHVIAGSPYGFYTTKTGTNGFSLITPSNFTTNNPQVNDIVFINHDTAIAVTGGDSAYDSGKGNIWKTTDGGLSWDSISPLGFSSGNTIAKGILGADTVIYVGTGLLNVDKGVVWKSFDLGQTWKKMITDINSMAVTNVQGLPINDIAVDPRGRDTLYLAAGYENNYAFVLSLNGAKTINYLNSYSDKTYSSIAVNEKNPDTVYVSTGREIYLYDLANNNSRFMFRLLPDERIPDLMSGSIIAATSTGLYTYRPTWEDDLDSGIIVNNAIKMVNNNEMTVFPNPFTDEATIKLYVKENSKVSIEMYDLMGQKIESIFSGSCKQGYSNYQIASHNLPSGSYLLYANVNDLPYRKLLYHVR